MADTIRLAVTASPSALPVVRMVLGGVAARVNLSLDEIEDLYLAVEELLSAAEFQGEGPRHELTIEVGDDALIVNAGPFKTAGLRERLSDDHAEAFGLRTVMDSVVQSIEICRAPNDCYSVVFAKRRAAT
jgi:hypothetical protein